MCHNDPSLVPSVSSTVPNPIEEYHQLTRIAMLHELEDERERVKTGCDLSFHSLYSFFFLFVFSSVNLKYELSINHDHLQLGISTYLEFY